MTGQAPRARGAAVPDPARLAAAVVACPAVARLDGGRFGQTASYLPGRRIDGIAVRRDQVDVSVVGAAGATASELSAQIAAATGPLVHGVPIHVVFADIDLPAPSGSV